jgi:hypothetical protein
MGNASALLMTLARPPPGASPESTGPLWLLNLETDEKTELGPPTFEVEAGTAWARPPSK